MVLNVHNVGDIKISFDKVFSTEGSPSHCGSSFHSWEIHCRFPVIIAKSVRNDYLISVYLSYMYHCYPMISLLSHRVTDNIPSSGELYVFPNAFELLEHWLRFSILLSYATHLRSFVSETSFITVCPRSVLVFLVEFFFTTQPGKHCSYARYLYGGMALWWSGWSLYLLFAFLQ